ncbi:MAG: hypothetical protein LC632_00175 [Xanthomonadaceae bacterium]|nr:hypothetical protein [Xanthomonadaceae bacterium]
MGTPYSSVQSISIDLYKKLYTIPAWHWNTFCSAFYASPVAAPTSSARSTRQSVISGQPNGQERLEWLAQVWFLNAVPERALPFMVSLRAEFARELAALEAIDAHWRSSDPRYPDKLPDTDLFPQFTLALGLKKLRVKLEWADECIALLEARAESQR